jgi:transcriptional regulator with XRE-family HTH domain
MVSATQLRAARKLLGWSRERLAAEAGVTVAEIAAVENCEVIGGGLILRHVRQSCDEQNRSTVLATDLGHSPT